MKLTEKYPQMKRDEEKVRQREALIIEKIESAEVTVPGDYSVDSIGMYATRAFIYPKDPTDVKVLAKEVGEVFEVAWELNFRKDSGKFYYVARKEDYWGKGESLIVLVENVPTSPNCKILSTKKLVKCFEKVCDKEEIDV